MKEFDNKAVWADLIIAWIFRIFWLTVQHQQRRTFWVWDHAVRFPVHGMSWLPRTFDGTSVSLHFHVVAFVHVHANGDHPVNDWKWIINWFTFDALSQAYLWWFKEKVGLCWILNDFLEKIYIRMSIQAKMCSQ